MKYLRILLLLTVFISCKQKVLSGPELEKKLVQTMQDYLDSTAKPGVVFRVKDIVYFPDKQKRQYNCEFHVNMRTQKSDTVGTMTANISNDFKKVKRIQ
jgi:hypothetical protein